MGTADRFIGACEPNDTGTAEPIGIAEPCIIMGLAEPCMIIGRAVPPTGMADADWICEIPVGSISLMHTKILGCVSILQYYHQRSHCSVRTRARNYTREQASTTHRKNGTGR